MLIKRPDHPEPFVIKRLKSCSQALFNIDSMYCEALQAGVSYLTIQYQSPPTIKKNAAESNAVNPLGYLHHAPHPQIASFAFPSAETAGGVKST